MATKSSKRSEARAPATKLLKPARLNKTQFLADTSVRANIKQFDAHHTAVLNLVVKNWLSAKPIGWERFDAFHSRYKTQLGQLNSRGVAYDGAAIRISGPGLGIATIFGGVVGVLDLIRDCATGLALQAPKTSSRRSFPFRSTNLPTPLRNRSPTPKRLPSF